MVAKLLEINLRDRNWNDRDCQHGFVHGNSHKIDEVFEEVTNHIDERSAVDVDYINVCKTFDKVK